MTLAELMKILPHHIEDIIKEDVKCLVVADKFEYLMNELNGCINIYNIIFQIDQLDDIKKILKSDKELSRYGRHTLDDPIKWFKKVYYSFRQIFLEETHEALYGKIPDNLTVELCAIILKKFNKTCLLQGFSFIILDVYKERQRHILKFKTGESDEDLIKDEENKKETMCTVA